MSWCVVLCVVLSVVLIVCMLCVLLVIVLRIVRLCSSVCVLVCCVVRLSGVLVVLMLLVSDVLFGIVCWVLRVREFGILVMGWGFFNGIGEVVCVVLELCLMWWCGGG